MLKNKLWITATFSAYICLGAQAAPLTLANKPIFIGIGDSPMVMLTMTRDHTLYYEAYNDATDLDGDGTVDYRYISKPSFKYYGLFDSEKCYTHTGSGESGYFTPTSFTTTKKCAGSDEWSGDFLNYVTTSRMDALKKVLYGGTRDIDTESLTILKRTAIPNDAHSWGKAYDPKIDTGYDIADYTPFTKPSTNKRVLFASTSWGSGNIATQPRLMVLTDRDEQIWDWVSKGAPVANTSTNLGSVSDVIKHYTVRVEACKKDFLEENCKKYEKATKPTGLLHTYGDTNEMQFGLLTGSYEKHLSGGVLRKPVSKFSDEYSETTGIFKNPSALDYGIVNTLNSLNIAEFNYSDPGNGYSAKGCGLITKRPLNRDQCRDWGAPVAELMYETLRYFAGSKTPSKSYSFGSSAIEDTLNLKRASWDDPFSARAYCTPSYSLVISGVNPSYDSDELPGANSKFQTNWASATTYGTYDGTTLTGFNAETYTSKVSQGELSGTQKFFIGQSLDDSSGGTNSPTPKDVKDFSKVRGMSPEEPTKGGGFYSAGVAYFGNVNDINSVKEGVQSVRNFIVALSSPLPQFRIKVDDEHEITLVPYGKSVYYDNTSHSVPTGNKAEPDGTNEDKSDTFQPTLSIVDYYIENWTPTEGRIRINFEDVEQGNDHDMDVIVQYDYKVQDVSKVIDGKTVTKKGVQITTTQLFQSAGIEMHAGYVISGTDADGIYLEISAGNGNKSEFRYFLDTLDDADKPYPNNYRNISDHAKRRDQLSVGTAAKGPRVRNFFVGETKAAGFLKSPLWYAAKWGGFNDDRDGPGKGNKVPDSGEWDTKKSGEPDNYFPVTNAGELVKQLEEAFAGIDSDASGRVRSVSFSSGQVKDDTVLYTATFDTKYWSGEIVAYDISHVDDVKDDLFSKPIWRTNTSFKTPFDSRVVYVKNDDGVVIPFANLPNTAALDGAAEGLSKRQVDSLLAEFLPTDNDKRLAEINRRISFLKGDRANEGKLYRKRSKDTVLGDIVDSAPVPFTLSDGTKLVTAGANDGMVHVLDGDDGTSLFSFIPSPVFDNLVLLTRAGYAHQKNFVNATPVIRRLGETSDSPVLAVGGLGSGGQGIYALDLNKAASATADKESAAQIVKWEFTDKNSKELGFTYGTPTITKIKAGSDTKWVVIFGNGYNSSVADINGAGSGAAALFIVDALTGELIKEISTLVGDSSSANGLSVPFVVDSDLDGYADRAYAGDLQGNLWAFDLADMVVAHKKEDGKPAPLFTAADAGGKQQPITSSPTAAYHPDGGLVVLFGTGKYLEGSDNKVNADVDTRHSFYAVWDILDGTNIEGRSSLQQQTIDYQDANTRLTSKESFTYGNGSGEKMGWYLDFLSPNVTTPADGYQGERLVTKPNLRFNKVAFTTLIPSENPCDAGGTGWYMELDVLFGKMWSKVPVYDEDGDVIEANLPLVSNKSVIGVPGNTATVLTREDGLALSVTPTTGAEPLKKVETDEPKGRQSWLQLF